MATLLLIIIYAASISLGLPDSLLGSAWPAMRVDMGMPLAAAGIVSMIVSGGTIVSSLFSERIIRRFGTGKVTLVSVLMTAAALLGFSLSGAFFWLCLMAVPLGLGAGAVDAALNNFVALHYEAKHMSWLHCFWGIGATAGPLVMSVFLAQKSGWRKGYLVIAVIQFILVAVLFFSQPLWKQGRVEGGGEETAAPPVKMGKLFSIPGVKVTLISFFCYCGIEATAGLWGSSYLVNSRGQTAGTAAQWVSLFYLGITLGRLASGFASMKISSKNLIRLGQGLLVLGALAFLLPLPDMVCAAGFVLMGLGCAPIYPSTLHETPHRFGSDLSQSLMGFQMAFAYVGTTCLPPFFGWLASVVSTDLFPIYLLALIALMAFCAERMNRIMAGRRP